MILLVASQPQGAAPWYQGFCRPESVRSGAHKAPVHRPRYRHHDHDVNSGIDCGNCLMAFNREPLKLEVRQS